MILAGCGSGDERASKTVATTPAALRSDTGGGRVVVRGDYAPDRLGPFAFDGRYRVRFVQRGAGVDFGAEVPFTAHLEQPGDGPPKTVELFEDAAASGTRTISLRGRYEVVVDFGDSPYRIEFAPAG